MDLDTAIDYVNNVLKANARRELKNPEIVVFRFSWQGMTFEQMANSSSYSSNYLMRDIAPKLWKTLSAIFQENISKSNLRLKLCKLYELSQLKLATSNKQNNRTNDRWDWKDAISSASVGYGRTKELQALQQAIAQDGCRLIKIWGLSGSGKTLLMKSLGEQIQDDYEVVIWRNLAECPSLEELLEDILRKEFNIIEVDRTQILFQLINKMRLHSCLILLDGMESLLQTKTLAGKYLSNRENYGDFFRLVSESSHQSCLVVTSLENFDETSNSKDSLIYNQKLVGLTLAEAKTLLEGENIKIDPTVEDLVTYYQGNPAILIVVAQIIRELFNGNVSEFLEQKSLIINNIARLLNRSFDRLSVLETEILYWLASESMPMSLSAIQQDIPLSIYPIESLEALKSLTGRLLVETTLVEKRSVFMLSPMIREFVTNQFITQIGDKFSLARRQNQRANNIINLGQATLQITQLSLWLQNRFQPSWQPVETLFAATGRSPIRLRSTFNLRSAETIKRFKQIDLKRENDVSVLLLVAISQEESAFKICVQAQPGFSQQTLPDRLKLSLIDISDRILASIQAQEQDHFIQLPYFRGVKQEKFKISLSLGSSTYEEEFVL